MKWFNKLLSLIGYVPKSKFVSKDLYKDALKNLDLLQTKLTIHQHFIDNIYKNFIEYEIDEEDNLFIIYAVTDTYDNYPIKVFKYTEETKDYVRICAEELCEMLNDN